MAWRLTPLTTYVAGSTPVIKAADLNSIQAAINDLFNGSHTVRRLHADGVGDQVTGAVDGQVKASELVATLNGVNASAGNINASASGAIVGASDGLLRAGKARQGTAAPLTTVPLGQAALEAMLIGWAVCSINGSHVASLVRGYNVKSVGGNTLEGPWTVTFNVAPANPADAAVWASYITAANDANPLGCIGTAEGGTGNLVANVRAKSGTGNPPKFVVLAFAG